MMVDRCGNIVATCFQKFKLPSPRDTMHPVSFDTRFRIDVKPGEWPTQFVSLFQTVPQSSCQPTMTIACIDVGYTEQGLKA